MWATAPLRSSEVRLREHALDIGWLALAGANYGLALAFQGWESLPFRFVWIALIVGYGMVVLRDDRMLVAVFALAGLGAALMLLDALHVVRLWNTPVDIPPVMALLCLVMVWHARRHQEAMREAHSLAEERRSLLERQERFVQDASHELRTPLTIARGHLELLRSHAGPNHDLNVALEEMTRLDEIISRLLLLATAGQPDFLRLTEVDLESFLEEVFVRWVDIAPRAWRLGTVPQGWLEVDSDRVRTALDALLENAVKHTREHDAIELRGRLGEDGTVILEVADQGAGVPAEALERIFDRFGRADPARGRAAGGVGLGLAIVDAIAKGHGGRCTVQSSSMGSAFTLELPGFTAAGDPGPRPDAVPSSHAPNAAAHP